jgi:Sec-independent protein translocase protein TatA
MNLVFFLQIIFFVAAGVVVLGFGFKKLAEYVLAYQANLHAHKEAVAQVKADATVEVTKVRHDAEKLGVQVARLAEQVALLATPERVAAVKTMNQNASPGLKNKIDRL